MCDFEKRSVLLSLSLLLCVKNNGKKITSTVKQNTLINTTSNMKSACVARYHTIRFPSLRDLVLFWHHNLDHINEAKLLSNVENNLIKGLPKELTMQAIRKYFPHACLACSIGNLQSLLHPLASIFNPKYQ
jgi:hypothetical protein